MSRGDNAYDDTHVAVATIERGCRFSLSLDGLSSTYNFELVYPISWFTEISSFSGEHVVAVEACTLNADSDHTSEFSDF